MLYYRKVIQEGYLSQQENYTHKKNYVVIPYSYDDLKIWMVYVRMPANQPKMSGEVKFKYFFYIFYYQKLFFIFLVGQGTLICNYNSEKYSEILA